MAINAVNNVSFEGENKKGSSGIVPGLLAGTAAGAGSYYFLKSPMTNEQIAGLDKDTFTSMAKDAKIDEDSTKAVSDLIEKSKVTDEDLKMYKDNADGTKDVLGGKTVDEYNAETKTLEDNKLKELQEKAKTAKEKADAKEATEELKTKAKEAADDVTKTEEKIAKRKSLTSGAKEGKISKEVYETYLKGEKQKPIIEKIVELGEKVEGKLKIKNWKRAAMVGAAAALVVGFLTRSSGSEAHQ